MQSIKSLLESRQNENIQLHDNINPQFAKVLKTIGFDKTYVKANGMSLFDKDGVEYFDFLSGYGVYALGRNHPQLKQMLHEVIDLDTANMIQMDAPALSGLLAEKLIELTGHGIRDTVYFTNSGTEAVESAIKFVRAATGREKILYLDHSFHGLSTGSLSLNGNKEFRDGFGDLLPGQSVQMNDLEALEVHLKTKEYAAFVFEPIQGKGVYVPDNNFYKEALALCQKYGTLTVADEVQAGLGRTGKWMASEHFDIEPDAVCFSKALSGGMVPVGAVVYKRSIYDKVFSRMDRCVVHSSTFGQNNLAMACGLATLDLMQEHKLLERAATQGEKLKQAILALKDRQDWIVDVRGKGLMIGIEFGKPSGFKKKMAWNVVHKLDKGLFGELIVIPLLSQHKILTQVSGHHQDIIKLIPPLIIEDHHIEHFVKSLESVLQDCEKVTGPILKMGTNLAKQALKVS